MEKSYILEKDEFDDYSIHSEEEIRRLLDVPVWNIPLDLFLGTENDEIELEFLNSLKGNYENQARFCK